MRGLILFVVAIFVNQTCWAETPLDSGRWQDDLAQYLRVENSIDDTTRDGLQARLVFEIFNVPNPEWAPAIKYLGETWRSHPEATEPIIRKLNSMWVRKSVSPLQAQTYKSQAQLIEQGKWFALFGLFVSTVKPRMLPLLVGAFLALQLSSDQTQGGRPAPYAILGDFKASPVAMQEEASRAFIDAKAELAAAGAGTLASYFISFGDVAGSIALRASRIVKQALVFGLVAYTVSGAARGYLNNARRSDLVTDVAYQRQQLERAMRDNSPALRSASHSFTQSALALSAFDSFEIAKFQNEESAAGQGPLMDALRNSCTDRVEKALLLKGQMDQDADEILKFASPSFQWEVRRQAAMAQSGRIRSEAEMATAVADFLRSSGKNRHFLEDLKAEVMTWDYDCSDGLYDLFKSVEDLYALKARYPVAFESQNSAQEGLDTIYEEFVLEMIKRRSLVEGFRVTKTVSKN